MLLWIPWATASATILQFAANSAQVSWQIKHTEFTCQLIQRIPDYGEAGLVQLGNGQLQFFIQSGPGLYLGALRRISIIPAPWQARSKPRVVGLGSGRENRPVNLGDDAARKVLLALQAGRFISLIYPMDSSPRIRVLVSSLFFHRAMGKLQRCVGALPTISFSEFSRTLIYFATNSVQLSQLAQKRLHRLARYIEAYGGIRLIISRGYTDRIGSMKYNFKLGLHRAEAVAKFLREQGVVVPIQVASQGKMHPVSSNQTIAGRARNRRVALILKSRGDSDKTLVP